MPATAEWTAEVKEFELYDEGLYMAQLVDVEKATGQYGEQAVWKLEFPDIEREDGQPVYLNFYTPAHITAKNKFGTLLMACRRPLPEPGDTMRPKGLIGEWVQARVVHYLRKTDGQMGCKVSELLPLTPKQRKGITLSMPTGKPPEDDEDEVPASDQQAQAAAMNAEQDARIKAVAEMRPQVSFAIGLLEAHDQKLGKENAGPGLTALAKSAKTQGVSIKEVNCDLISLSTIKLATAEANAIIAKLEGAPAGDDEDPFVDGQ